MAGEYGHIPLSRRMFSGRDPLWEGDEPFDRRSAWVDLIQLAAFQPRQRMLQGQLIALDRGQLFASERFLAERWHWSRAAVRRFLTALEEKLKRIEVKPAHGAAHLGSVITICKYEDYNTPRGTDRPTDRPGVQPVSAHTRPKIEEREELNTPSTTSRAGETGTETTPDPRLEMWAEFDARAKDLVDPEKSRARAVVRGIIEGDTNTAWMDQTGTPVPWSERPRLFRLAMDERSANGGKLHVVLRQVVIPREFDPFPQTKSSDRRPVQGTEAARVLSSTRDHDSGAGRIHQPHQQTGPQLVAVDPMDGYRAEQEARAAKIATLPPEEQDRLRELAKRKAGKQASDDHVEGVFVGLALEAVAARDRAGRLIA